MESKYSSVLIEADSPVLEQVAESNYGEVPSELLPAQDVQSASNEFIKAETPAMKQAVRYRLLDQAANKALAKRRKANKAAAKQRRKNR